VIEQEYVVLLRHHNNSITLDHSYFSGESNGKIDGLTQQLDVANKRIDLLEKENAILKEQLAIYETPKDSHNQSIPPSKDSLAAQAEKSKKLLATRSLREKSGKSNGGQMGHKGTTLVMVGEPESIIEHAPYFCTLSRNDLLAVQGSVIEIQEVFDVPMPVQFPIGPIHCQTIWRFMK
jgi:transposase